MPISQKISNDRLTRLVHIALMSVMIGATIGVPDSDAGSSCISRLSGLDDAAFEQQFWMQRPVILQNT
eukprot:SAG11_NODE_25991_length_351_cov_0.785714_1_plen_67_part_10